MLGIYLFGVVPFRMSVVKPHQNGNIVIVVLKLFKITKGKKKCVFYHSNQYINCTVLLLFNLCFSYHYNYCYNVTVIPMTTTTTTAATGNYRHDN